MNGEEVIQIEGRILSARKNKNTGKCYADVGYAFGQAPVSVMIDEPTLNHVDKALNDGATPDCVFGIRLASRANIVKGRNGGDDFASTDLQPRIVGLKLKRAA